MPLLKMHRVRLDLAELGADVRKLRTGEALNQEEMRDQLELLGWVERDGWWTAPSRFELAKVLHAVVDTEG